MGKLGEGIEELVSQFLKTLGSFLKNAPVISFAF